MADDIANTTEEARFIKQTRNFDIQRVIVKIGSSLLTNNGRGLDRTAIYEWAKQIAKLHKQGVEVLLVSSGAVAEGVVRMNLEERPRKLAALQACASIGQMGLIETWWSALIQHGIQSSQLLLTHDDLSNRSRYLNTTGALTQLLDWRVLPVINENDTITIDEIKFGDNDTLGAMAAAMVNADLYIILTDQEGVFTDNPRDNPNAKMIRQERAMADYLFDIAGEGYRILAKSEKNVNKRLHQVRSLHKVRVERPSQMCSSCIKHNTIFKLPCTKMRYIHNEPTNFRG